MKPYETFKQYHLTFMRNPTNINNQQNQDILDTIEIQTTSPIGSNFINVCDKRTFINNIQSGSR